MATHKTSTDKFSDIPQNTITPGGSIAPFGFGAYRVSVHQRAHQTALHQALSRGINLIDTSTNYSDGQSEELIGEVVGRMLHQDELKRQDLHIVTKVGYIQGSNLERVNQLEGSHAQYADIVDYGEHLRHCIAPRFIEDQLSESLKRLNLTYVDTLLLHNPEYYLMHASGQGLDVSLARAEFYRRLQLAFEQLEREVSAGRIRSYGISSNTFVSPANAADFCSLERAWQIAQTVNSQHHFRVVQMPFNLLEHNAATQLNQQDGSSSVLDFAEAHQLRVLINRPLNAITQSQLIRLAAPQEFQAVSESEIHTQLQKVMQLEERFHREILPGIQLVDAEKTTLLEWLSPASALNRSLDAFDGREHWNSAKQRHFEPRIKHGIDFLARLKDPAVDVWAGSFIAQNSKLFNLIDNLHAGKSAQQAQKLLQKYGPIFQDQTDSLSHLALNAVRRHSAVSCVLVGMRRRRYVSDCLAALQVKDLAPTSNAAWHTLS